MQIAFGHAGVKREAGEDGKLLSRVAAGNIHRRIGLGKAEPLCLGQRS